MPSPLDPSAVRSLPPFDPTFPGFQFAELSGGRTGYRIVGEQRADGVSVVCMHGIGWWSFCFDDLAASLAAAGHRCLIFDFYGRGSSAAPSATYAPSLFVEQTRELLDHVGWRQPVHLIGISMGGAVATHFTNTYPDRVASVVLCAPAVTPVELPFVARLTLMPYIGPLLFYLLGQRAMLKRLHELRCSDDILRSEERAELVDALIQRMEWVILNKPGYTSAFHGTMVGFNFTGGQLAALAAMAKLRKPTLLVWGRDDLVIPFERHTQVLERLPHAKFVDIPSASHALFFDAPEPTTRAVADFLRSVRTGA